jgi:transcriptional regulator with XRE-family HTH domain
LGYAFNVGFKENLKSELVFQNKLVKELALETGISRHTLDNYLNQRGHVPAADVAVKIAQNLGVSVEYLVTGDENSIRTSSFSPEIRILLQNFKQLNEKDRDLVLSIVQLVKNQGKNKTAKYGIFKAER